MSFYDVIILRASTWGNVTTSYFFLSLKFSITKTKNLNHVKNAFVFTKLMLPFTSFFVSIFFQCYRRSLYFYRYFTRIFCGFYSQTWEVTSINLLDLIKIILVSSHFCANKNSLKLKVYVNCCTESRFLRDVTRTFLFFRNYTKLTDLAFLYYFVVKSKLYSAKAYLQYGLSMRL